jgi:hypothetical protein
LQSVGTSEKKGSYWNEPHNQAPRKEHPAETSYLDDYRAAVERLRGETVAEIGRQPMPPEKFSMFAVMIASLPLVALMHPAIPVAPHGWQDGLALFAVWLAAFWVQRLRYARFQARWHRKIAAHHAAETIAVAEERGFLGGQG